MLKHALLYHNVGLRAIIYGLVDGWCRLNTVIYELARDEPVDTPRLIPKHSASQRL
jgi:hypothetical protein